MKVKHAWKIRFKKFGPLGPPLSQEEWDEYNRGRIQRISAPCDTNAIDVLQVFLKTNPGARVCGVKCIGEVVELEKEDIKCIPSLVSCAAVGALGGAKAESKEKAMFSNTNEDLDFRLMKQEEEVRVLKQKIDPPSDNAVIRNAFGNPDEGTCKRFPILCSSSWYDRNEHHGEMVRKMREEAEKNNGFLVEDFTCRFDECAGASCRFKTEEDYDKFIDATRDFIKSRGGSI
jgi:hypothetical protein